MESKIKPSTPTAIIILIVILTGLPMIFLASPHLDWEMGLGGGCIFIMAIVITFLIDRSNSTIFYDDKTIHFKGFFGLRNESYRWKDFKGYSIKEKADQASGLHDEIRLIFFDKKKIVIPKVAYKHSYNQIYVMCTHNLKFLEHSQLKNGNTKAWVIRIIFMISGIMALLVGLKKLN